MNQRAKYAVIIGYSGDGYRLWLPSEEKVIKSRNVHFEENIIELNNLWLAKV